MTGIALIIIILHIHPVFGTHSPHTITGVLSSLGKLYTEFNPAALLIALETFVLLYGLKFVAKNLPAPLIALIIATITSVCLNLDVPTIGAIPSQLPIPSLPSVEWSAMSAVLLGGLTIAILGAIDSLLTSLIADKLLHERHNSNKELIGQGVGNFVSGLIGGIPGAGSTTRTLANIYSGGRGPLAGLVYGGLVLLTITYLGTLASLIPLASLAAILIVLGINIIDWRSLGRLKALPLNDVIVMVVVLGLTLFADLVAAVGVGVALTCLLFVRKLSLRAASRQGILAQMSEAKQFFHSHSNDLLNKIYLYYFSGPLYFIEASKFSISLGELDDEPLQVVLIFQNNELLDQSFAFSLEDTISSMRKQEHYVWIVGLSEQNQNKLSELGCREALSAEFICGDLQEVVGRVNSLCSRRQSSDESVLLS
jgi:SulP family sulfate permease